MGLWRLQGPPASRHLPRLSCKMLKKSYFRQCGCSMLQPRGNSASKRTRAQSAGVIVAELNLLLIRLKYYSSSTRVSPVGMWWVRGCIRTNTRSKQKGSTTASAARESRLCNVFSLLNLFFLFFHCIHHFLSVLYLPLCPL